MLKILQDLFTVKLHPAKFLLEGKDCKALPKGLAVQIRHTPNKQGRQSVHWCSIWPRTFLTWSLLIILWASCSLLHSHALSFPPLYNILLPGVLPRASLQDPCLSQLLLTFVCMEPARGSTGISCCKLPLCRVCMRATCISCCVLLVAAVFRPWLRSVSPSSQNAYFPFPGASLAPFPW